MIERNDNRRDAADAPALSLEECLSHLADEDLKRFRGLSRSLQLRSVFVRNRRMADWFDAVAAVVTEELKRREGKDADLTAAQEHVIERTAALADEEIEAIAMGFATLDAKRGEKLGEDLRSAISAAYEPVRREYLKRQASSPTVDENM